MRRAMFALPLLLVVGLSAQSRPSSSQQVVVRNITLTGVTQLSPDEQQEIVSRLQKSYGIISFGHISDKLREALQNHGFYKATVEQPKVTVVSGSERNGTVDVAFEVSEGQRYRLKNVSFSNNHAFSAEQLREVIPIEDGAVFSTAKARQGFVELRKLYVGRGYIDFVPSPELVVDEPAATISMHVDLNEGVPFRVGALVFDGAANVTPETTARLRKAWKKYEGHIYSNEVMPEFVRDNSIDLPQNEKDTQRFRIVVDREEHVLDFRLDLGGIQRPEAER